MAVRKYWHRFQIWSTFNNIHCSRNCCSLDHNCSCCSHCHSPDCSMALRGLYPQYRLQPFRVLLQFHELLDSVEMGMPERLQEHKTMHSSKKWTNKQNKHKILVNNWCYWFGEVNLTENVVNTNTYFKHLQKIERKKIKLNECN